MPLLEERTVPRRPTYALHEERDLYQIHFYIIVDFLIHTLRGERDKTQKTPTKKHQKFQLTRSVGSVTDSGIKWILKDLISTHTLRGERDRLGGSNRKHCK